MWRPVCDPAGRCEGTSSARQPPGKETHHVPRPPPATINGFHAHIYYDAESRETAARLRAAIEENFDVRMGRWHDHPIGPHPRWSYQVAFAPDLFGAFIPWLALNRRGLVVFVHPETGDSVPDHTDHALWMGEKLDLNIDKLR